MTSAEVPSRLPMLKPFAFNGTRDAIPDSTGDFMNITQGFPSVYGIPKSSGGKYVSRSDMNSLGFIATNDIFYHKCGGLNTFDASFSDKIGGYPKGAVLQFLNGNYLYNVISLHDNNTFNFVSENSINGVDWAYCNEEMATTDRILVFESNQTLFSTGTSTSSMTYTETFLGVFKATKSGPVIFEGGIEPIIVHAASQPSGTSGVGIFIIDLGESYNEIPKLSIDTISQWTAVALFHGNLGTSIGDMVAQFNHYYAVKGFVSSCVGGYVLESYGTSTARWPTRFISGATNNTKIYIG